MPCFLPSKVMDLYFLTEFYWFAGVIYSVKSLECVIFDGVLLVCRGNVEGSLRKGVERRRSRPLERANESERVKRLTVREPRKARPAAEGGRMRPEK